MNNTPPPIDIPRRVPSTARHLLVPLLAVVACSPQENKKPHDPHQLSPAAFDLAEKVPQVKKAPEQKAETIKEIHTAPAKRVERVNRLKELILERRKYCENVVLSGDKTKIKFRADGLLRTLTYEKDSWEGGNEDVHLEVYKGNDLEKGKVRQHLVTDHDFDGDIEWGTIGGTIHSKEYRSGIPTYASFWENEYDEGLDESIAYLEKYCKKPKKKKV